MQKQTQILYWESDTLNSGLTKFGRDVNCHFNISQSHIYIFTFVKNKPLQLIEWGDEEEGERDYFVDEDVSVLLIRCTGNYLI